jgi:hypothetical protein
MEGGREFLIPHELEEVHARIVDSANVEHSGILKAYPELKDLFANFLESVDVPLIQRLIKKQLTRAGVPESKVNLVKISDILLSTSVEGGAAHSFVTNHVKIYADSFKNFLRYPVGTVERERGLINFARVIIHEIVHSMSCVRGGFSTEDEGEMTRVHSDGSSGFHTNERKNTAQNEGWNEAITERISDEILLVYSRCKGLNTSYVYNTVLQENNPKHLSKDKYVAYRLMMQVITEQIAEYAGTTSETVWCSIKERYFSGGVFNDEAIQDLFKETFGEKFITDLSKIKNLTSRRKLKRFMNKYHIRIDTRTANRWFRELGLNYYLIPRDVHSEK